MVEERLIISHVRESDKEIQTNDKHQQGVAKMAESFAAEFCMGDFGKVMGLLHDKGKEQSEWQKYIQGVTGYKPEYAYVKKGPHHAYVGAVIAKKLYPSIYPLIAQPIAGHHRGLYDYSDYEEEIKRLIPNDVTIGDKIQCSSMKLPMTEFWKEDLHHLIRMLFSCLVDADSLDTEQFLNPEQSKLRGCCTSIQELLKMMESHLQTLRMTALDTEVNQIRNYVQDQCVKESQGGMGFYSLTVPTGGGKTLASVLWALQHAVKNNLQRIIIAIPYTSIIVQTAATLKNIFGEDNVLEHHSNVNPEDTKDKELRERLQLSTENWDYPIIVTTNVQLFESLFSNKRSACRKLHNIVNSVIILDEVQTLPLCFYKPIVHTLNTLKRVFGSSILFTTASQPILSGRIVGANPNASFDALQSVHEIIPQESQLHDKLRRVELQFLEGAMTYDNMAEELSKYQRVLCIVNTRRDAKELYDRLPKEGICLHLSRMMCPAHVSSTIQRIKEALHSHSSQPIRVIATQLIEAGVDIDFPVVFRQEAGLDSILQAAGRCNREGKYKKCTTYVFSLGKEHPLPIGYITQTNNARLNMGRNLDWFAPETMKSYFEQLYCRVPSFDQTIINGVRYSMEDLLYKKETEFEKAADVFRLIDDQTTSVIINWGDSLYYYQHLISQGPSYVLMKKLAQYSVNIRKRDFEMFQSIDAINNPYENIFAITNSDFYKTDTGLLLNNQWLEETYII